MKHEVEINPEWPAGLTWLTTDKHDPSCPVCGKQLKTAPPFLRDAESYQLMCPCEKGAVLYLSPPRLETLLRSGNGDAS